MLFLNDNNEYISPNGKSFRDLMEEGKANYENFQLHLSTIFTEVRLKKYIELRSIDACEWDCHCAGPAFLIGLLYGNLNETYEIINKWKKKDILEAYFNSPSKGFGTEIDGKSILDWSDIFLKLSKSFSTSSLVILKPVFGGTTKLIMDGTSFRYSTLSYDFIPAI